MAWAMGPIRPLAAVGGWVDAHPRAALVLVLALAAGLRMINLDAKPLWYDEAFAVLYAEKDLGSILYGTYASVQGAAADVHPVSYYALLHFWLTLGQEPWLVRIPSLVLGVGTVYLAYLLMRHLFDPRAAVLGAVLVAISPFHIWYSQEARMYGLLAFVLLLAAYALVRALRDAGRRWWGVFAFAAAASAYVHNLGIFTLLPLVGYAAWTVPPAHRRYWLASSLALTTLLIPWAILVWGQIAKVGQAYWVGRPGLAEIVRTITTFTFHQPALNLPAPDAWIPWLLFFSLALLVFIARATLPLMASQGEVRDGAVLLAVLAAGPAVLMFTTSLIRPVYLERALLASGAAYALLLGLAVSRGSLPTLVRAAPVLTLPLVGVSLAFQYTYDGFPRSPFPEAVAYLRERSEADDLVLHDNKLSFFPSHYYDRALSQAFLSDPPGAGSDTLAMPTQEVLGLYGIGAVSEVAPAYARIWFVIFQQAVEEANSSGIPNPHLTWLDSHRVRSGPERIGDLLIYRYDNRSAAA